MEDRRKHLEFIQNVIDRHNSNSFMLKGWTITITAALYALAGTVQEPNIVLIALAPISLFWGLDAFYLSNERCFVDLYNAAVSGNYRLPNKAMFKKELRADSNEVETGTVVTYNMNFKKFKIWKDNSWLEVLKSKTIFWFYFPQVAISFLIMALFVNISTNEGKPIEVSATLKSNGLELKINSDPPTITKNIDPLIKSEDTDTVPMVEEDKEPK